MVELFLENQAILGCLGWERAISGTKRVENVILTSNPVSTTYDLVDVLDFSAISLTLIEMMFEEEEASHELARALDGAPSRVACEGSPHCAGG